MIELAHIEYLWLLWTLPVLLGLYVWFFYRKKIAISRYVDSGLLDKLYLNVSTFKLWLKGLILLLVVLAMIIALAQPQWNAKPEKVKRQGRDLVILLDVSRSMLAEDIKPNRLDRALLDIEELLYELSGDRIGVVVFSGSTVVKCPLTLDYSFARLALKEINTYSVTKGGTLIGDAIRKTIDEVFDEDNNDFKDIILITDGEDHESFPVEAARLAGEKGVRIIIIGVGDEETGSRVPEYTENGQKSYLKYNGQEVWSKLDSVTLKEVAQSTPGGYYLNVATGNYDLPQLYHALIESSERREMEEVEVMRYEEKYQIFLLVALTLLVIEALVSERKT
jgi:Ca-activated chloride channel family protein